MYQEKLENVTNDNQIFMSIRKIQIKQLIGKKCSSFSCIYMCAVLMLFLFLGTDSAEAQEYATDRMFIKQYNSTKCRNEAEKMIRNIKNSPEMTLEQEALLNQNVWAKLRTNLPLSPGEKKHLNKLKERGVSTKKMKAKDLWKQKAVKFKEIRLKCKQAS